MPALPSRHCSSAQAPSREKAQTPKPPPPAHVGQMLSQFAVGRVRKEIERVARHHRVTAALPRLHRVTSTSTHPPFPGVSLDGARGLDEALLEIIQLHKDRSDGGASLGGGQPHMNRPVAGWLEWFCCLRDADGFRSQLDGVAAAGGSWPQILVDVFPMVRTVETQSRRSWGSWLAYRLRYGSRVNRRLSLEARHCWRAGGGESTHDLKRDTEVRGVHRALHLETRIGRI